MTETTSNNGFSALTIGVLELQGDFAEHTAMLRQCGVGKVIGIRQPTDLTDELDGIIFPGGESTVMSKLLVEQGMLNPIQNLSKQNGLPMFGTCAGCILLARDIRQRPDQPRIGVLGIAVDRNAYGAQIDSFETFINFQNFQHEDSKDDSSLRVVHIRAPVIAEILNDDVEVLAEYKGKPILVKQGGLLACTFHPELTKDTRVHRLFLRTAMEHRKKIDNRKQ